MKNHSKRDSQQPAPGESGSIEQQLDMVEGDGIRGEEILHSHGRPFRHTQGLDREELEFNYQFDMSEENREGSEMTGDEHSSGLQGSESHAHASQERESDVDGLPGDESRSQEDEVDLQEKRRAG